ncbi:hypothetical protein EVAR_82266_1 [Eumeta japonica]|uniref:Uncharacterized protein n=1 Tax=Eumeta variegata TaxID=151549 RepID=A0A4C1W102_EUMVA|nr:hypothetical protein EVAR_82266_1 [Eumeta japonica]
MELVNVNAGAGDSFIRRVQLSQSVTSTQISVGAVTPARPLVAFVSEASRGSQRIKRQLLKFIVYPANKEAADRCRVARGDVVDKRQRTVPDCISPERPAFEARQLYRCAPHVPEQAIETAQINLSGGLDI